MLQTNVNSILIFSIPRDMIACRKSEMRSKIYDP